MKSPTLSDVARHAGVSYATADRVLNARARVSDRIANRVRDAVEQLGYVRNVAASNLSRNRRYRFAFILPEGENAFFQSIRRILSDRIERHAPGSAAIDVHKVPAFDAPKLLERLAELSDADVDGIAVVGLDADVLSAPLETLRSRGVPVVSLVSDLPRQHRDAYIGIDNLAAGRTAARLLGTAHAGQTGLVQLVVGDMAARDHLERHDGFMEVVSRDYQNIKTLPVVEGRDHADTVGAALDDVIRRQPGVTGIYSVGAGNSGLFRVLTSMDRTPVVVVHELVSHSREALESGVCDFVIDQCPEEEVDNALELIGALVNRVPAPPTKPILPTIYVRDNLPPIQTGLEAEAR